MSRIELGFINTPYSNVNIHRPMTAARAESKRARRRYFSKTMTAEDVANILEDKYHILDHFWKFHEKDVKRSIRATVLGRLLRILNGSRIRYDFQSVAKPVVPDIEKQFREFLDKKEMDKMGVPGVPTIASLIGTSRRYKKLRPGRPSFVDTGIYRASFRVTIR